MKKTLYLMAATVALAMSSMSFAAPAAFDQAPQAEPVAVVKVTQSSEAVAIATLKSTADQAAMGHVHQVGNRQAEASASGGEATRRPVRLMAAAAPLTVNWRAELPRYSG